MPGGFTGYLNNKPVAFETFNAIHIDIKSSSGSPLNFKLGSSMNISMRVGSSDFGNSTYFWELNKGRWVSQY